MYLTFHYKKKHLQAICYTLITTKGKNTFHLPYTYYIIGTQHTHKHKKIGNNLSRFLFSFL